MKIKIIITGFCLALAVSASAATYSFFSDGPFNNNGGAGDGVIPDNSTIGLSDSHLFSGEPPLITAVSLSVTLQHGFGSDLSGYLRMGTELTSPYAILTPALQGLTLNENSATPFTLDLTSYFQNLNPNTMWTLFFADSSAGGQTTLNDWSLMITSEVPEPTTWALIVFGIVFGTVQGARFFRRRLRVANGG